MNTKRKITFIVLAVLGIGSIVGGYMDNDNPLLYTVGSILITVALALLPSILKKKQGNITKSPGAIQGDNNKNISNSPGATIH